MTVVEAIRGELALAEEWEQVAENIRRFDPESREAKLLSQCAAELKEHASEAQPDWIGLSAVVAWSGWSARTLRKRCREQWSGDGLARQTSSGRWELSWDAVRRIRPKVSAEDLEGLSPEAVVDALWRRTG